MLLDLDNLRRQHSELLAAVQNLERRLIDMGRVLSQTRDSENSGIDFGTIQHCAKQFPFDPHPLRGLAGAGTAVVYLIILLQVVQFEAGDPTNPLIFIQWIRDQTKIRKKLPELLQNSYDYDKKRLFSLLSNALTGDLAEMLLLDLLISASMNGPPNEDALNFIAEIAALLKLDEKSVIAASAARYALSGKKAAPAERRVLNALPRSCTIYLPESMRRVSLEPSWDIKWKCDSDTFVQKGQVLGTQWSSGRTDSLRAPCSGRLFTGMNQGQPYGVIGLLSDSRDIAKSWLRKQQEEA